MKALYHFTAKRVDELNDLLKKSPLYKQQAETLHKLRVNIKKIRALLRLVQYDDPKFNYKKQYKPFRKVFRAAGKIREHDITAAILSKHINTTTVPLTTLDAPTTKQLKKIAEQRKKIKKCANLLLKELRRIDSESIYTYLHMKREYLRQQLATMPPEEKLHDLRKQIKDVIYLLNAVQQEEEFSLFLSELEALIGKWHDKAVALNYLQQYAPEENEALQSLKSECQTLLFDIYQYINKHSDLWNQTNVY